MWSNRLLQTYKSQCTRNNDARTRCTGGPYHTHWFEVNSSRYIHGKIQENINELTFQVTNFIMSRDFNAVLLSTDTPSFRARAMQDCWCSNQKKLVSSYDLRSFIIVQTIYQSFPTTAGIIWINGQVLIPFNKTQSGKCVECMHAFTRSGNLIERYSRVENLFSLRELVLLRNLVLFIRTGVVIESLFNF